jgi:hypothetical protein
MLVDHAREGRVDVIAEHPADVHGDGAHAPPAMSKILLPALVPPAGRQILRADHLFAAVEPGWSNDQNLWMARGLVTWWGAPSRG